jgi:hypothetical protein
MPDRPDDFDAELERRLAASESRIPASMPPLDSPPSRNWWLAPVLIAGTALAAFVLAVVAIPPLLDRRTGDATPSPDGGVRAESRSGDLVLALASTRREWTEDESIEVVATLTYTGDLPQLDLRGGGGPVVFGLRQIAGGDAAMGGGQDLPCIQYPIGPDQPLVWPFAKAGAVEAPPFDMAFFQDPELHLPPGRWEVSVQLDYGIGACAGLSMQTAIEIEVVAVESSEEPALTASPTPTIAPTPTVELTPSPSGQACMDAMTGGILGADAEGRPVVRFEDRPPFRVDLSHLDDFIRIETEPFLTIYNRRGDTIATEGDFVELTGGFNADETVFHACGISRPPTGEGR